MHEQPEVISKQPDEQEISRQIQLAEMNLPGRTLGEVITIAMGKCDDDAERAAHSLVAQKVFEKTADCPDPEVIARAAVERYQKHGERLREEEKPL